MLRGYGFFFSSKASSSKLREPQAASFKPQATRFKLQATSCKLPDRGPFIKFYGARTEGLDADERIEVHESTKPGDTSVRVVLKPNKEELLIMPPGYIKDY